MIAGESPDYIAGWEAALEVVRARCEDTISATRLMPCARLHGPQMDAAVRVATQQLIAQIDKLAKPEGTP